MKLYILAEHQVICRYLYTLHTQASPIYFLSYAFLLPGDRVQNSSQS